MATHSGIFFLYKFIYFNWRLITLQYCIGFLAWEILQIKEATVHGVPKGLYWTQGQQQNQVSHCSTTSDVFVQPNLLVQKIDNSPLYINRHKDADNSKECLSCTLRCQHNTQSSEFAIRFILLSLVQKGPERCWKADTAGSHSRTETKGVLFHGCAVPIGVNLSVCEYL